MRSLLRTTPRARRGVGAATAVANVGAAVLKEGVDAGDPLVGIDVLDVGLTVAIGQTFDLIHVEDGVATSG